MSSDTNSNEFERQAAMPRGDVTANGSNSVAIGGDVSRATVIAGGENQIGHRAGGDVVEGDKTTINNHVSLKWLLPFLLIIAAGVCVIAWQASRHPAQEEEKSRQVLTPSLSPTVTPSLPATAPPSETPTSSPVRTFHQKKTSPKNGSGVKIVEQTVKDH